MLYETSEAIVAGIGQGESEAEEALVRKYSASLLYVLRNRTKDDEFSRDIQQETFLIVLEKLRSTALKDPAKLGAYLHQTAINLFIGEMRKSGRRRTSADTELIEAVAEEGNQYAVLIRNQAAQAVRRLINEMDNERDRLILQQFYLDENDKERVCANLDLTYRHFDRVISRARNRFKILVEENMDSLAQDRE